MSKLGERFEWHGHLAVQPIESDGEFQIAGLQAHTIWAYLEDQLNFQVNSGKIDVNATYKFALRDDADLKVEVSKVALTDLTLRPRNSEVDWISVPQLFLNRLRRSTARQRQRCVRVTKCVHPAPRNLQFIQDRPEPFLDDFVLRVRIAPAIAEK